MQGRSKIYPFYALIAAPEIPTELLWDLTMLFVVLCALYFGVIFFFRRKLTLGSKSNRKRKKELSPMISEFLFYDEDASKEEKTNYVSLKIEIRDLLNDDFNRKILIDILMDLRKDLSGSTLGKLFELYQGLGLHHDSYKKLESWRWHAISKGILELTQMQVEESYGFVTKFINDKRSTIRKQAEMAIITLNDEGLNYFLDTTTYRISEWQQLKILEVLKSKSDFQPPSFKHWLISKNKDVVLFALRLMGHYNQSDGNQALIELLKHKKSEIKAAAINCIKEFHVVEAVETLKLVFWNSSVDIKINILDALASLGNTNDIAFLESIAAKESNFNVKSKASATLNTIVPMSVMPTMDIQSVDKFKVPADIPIEVVEKNDEEKMGSDAEEETLKVFETSATGIQIEAIEEQRIGYLETDQVVEEKEVLNEKHEIEEDVLQESLEEIEVDVLTPFNDENVKESEEEVFQESYEMEQPEPAIENNEEIEADTDTTFTMDFLPFVTEKPNAITPYHYKKSQKLVSEELFNIETISEIVEHNPVTSIEEEGEELQEELPVKAEKRVSLKSIEIDFLPIVTGEVKTALPYKFETKQEGKVIAPDLFNIETTSQVVGQKDISHIESEQPQKQKLVREEEISSMTLDFLPIVIASDIDINQNESAETGKPIDVFEIPVSYSEVRFKAPEAKTNKILSELNELAPLPATLLPENKTQHKKHRHQNLKEPTSINTIDMKKIKKIECEGVEIKTENQENVQETKQEIEAVIYDDFDKENKPEGQNTLDWILAENEAKGELKQKIKTIVNQQKVSSIKLPKPIFYSEQEANTVALLDDIEALGDEREVPLLQDLLLDQDTLSLHERIHSLIERISGTAVLKRDPIINDDKDNFSVFEEFFRNADSESRLILLDEIVALGDEKDLGFLKRLINNSSGKVKKKAMFCIEGLTTKLVQDGNEVLSDSSNEAEIVPQSESIVEKNNTDNVSKPNETGKVKPFSVFEIDFEVDFDKEYEKKPK